MGCAVAEHDAGPAVELGFDAGKVTGGVDGEIGRLREILPQQPVGVLVAAALPGLAASQK